MSETTLGGARFQFGETLWTRVLAAKTGAREALDELVRAYWKPVYHFIRSRGKSIEDAKDLTQGFFAMLLERKSIARVDPAKGKFKTFLLTATVRYLASEHERLSAEKRGGGRHAVPLDLAAAERDLKARTPEEAFEQAWAEAVLARAFERMRETPYFEVLDLHITHHLGVTAIARRLGRKPKDVENGLGRGRRRLREAVLEEIVQCVSSPGEAEEEFRTLVTRVMK